MAKKIKEVVTEETPEEQLRNELVAEAAATPVAESKSIKDRADEIVALFPEIGNIEGEKIDLNNPNHRIIAAYLVGRLGLLRK